MGEGEHGRMGAWEKEHYRGIGLSEKIHDRHLRKSMPGAGLSGIHFNRNKGDEGDIPGLL